MMRGKILALKQVRVKVIGQLEQRKVKLHRGRVQRVLPLHTTPAELTALSIKTLMNRHKFVFIIACQSTIFQQDCSVELCLCNSE